MSEATKVVSVTPGSELARLREEAGEAPLVLEKDGARYRLSREDTGEFISSQEFYEEVTQRVDVREILRRLAQ